MSGQDRPCRPAAPPELPVPPEMRPVEVGIDHRFYRFLWAIYAVLVVYAAREIIWVWTR